MNQKPAKRVERTPGPWAHDSNDDGATDQIITAKDGRKSICQVHAHSTTSEAHNDPQGETLANRDFIVQAANAHGRLVEAVRGLLLASTERQHEKALEAGRAAYALATVDPDDQKGAAS